MMKRFALTAIAAATFTTVALGTAIVTPAAAQSLGINIGTPAPYYYGPPVQYAPPVQRVWVPGAWQWYGGRQVWVDGRWASGPRAPYWKPTPWHRGWHHGWYHD